MAYFIRVPDPADPILEFRARYRKPEERDRLRRLLAERQAEYQAKIGTLGPGDFFSQDLATIQAVNYRDASLKQVRLNRFAVDVEDADTLLLRRRGLSNWAKSLLGRGVVQVRLAGIDAPEIAGHEDDPLAPVRIWQEQPGGQESVQALRELIEEQQSLSLLVSTGRKTYGRYLGVLGGDEASNLNIELLKRGAVTALPFGNPREDLVPRHLARQAELEARDQQLGLWAYKRYQAQGRVADLRQEQITHNTLTRLDKLSQDMVLGSYATYLASMGAQQGALESDEEILARDFYSASLKKIALRGRRFSGRDDSYNTIEGLRHGGLAEQMRQGMTSFGSGWDPLRAIAKEALGITGKLSEKAFNAYIRSSAFQGALRSAEVVKFFKPGGQGAAVLMEASLRVGGKLQKLQFVRKALMQEKGVSLGQVAREARKEAKVLRALQRENVPSLYGTEKGTIAMEYIPGESAGSLLRRGEQLSEAQLSDLEDFFSFAHRQGYAHMDLMQLAGRSPTGEIGRYLPGAKTMIPTGEVVPHNIMVTPEGRMAVIDWGLSTRAANISPDLFTVEYAEALSKERGLLSAQMYDNLLLQGLRKQEGKLRSVQMARMALEAQAQVAIGGIRGGRQHTQYTSNSLPALPTAVITPSQLMAVMGSK